MTTGGCCHLPGSLCDCASSTGVWKSVEEGGGDGCQALYVTQVTAIDGRMLSSVLKPIATQRLGLQYFVMCRNTKGSWQRSTCISDFIKIFLSYIKSQWWSHLPYLPWGRQQWESPVPMRLHRYPRHGAQELPREVVVVFKHQLLWALPYRVQHRAPAKASHRGNKGQCPLPCLHQSFCS